MTTELTYGRTAFRFGDDEGRNDINTGPTSAVRRALYKRYVSGGVLGRHELPSAQPTIGRFGRLRYLKPTLPPEWWCVGNPLSLVGVDNQWINPGQFDAGRETKTGRHYGSVVSMDLTHDSLAVGSVGVRQTWNDGSYPPNGMAGNPFISFIDLPGTVVGNRFKHPIGRAALFNEVGQVATSQGNLSVLGVFDPPENLAYHYGYQVYYTKSGGTGTVDVGVGSQINGSLTAGGGSDDLFTDSAAGGHFTVGAGVDDGNHYVAINESGGRQGIYLITSRVGDDSVRIDTKQVNEPVGGAENNLDWTLREGPIAEYFVRRRRYNHFDTWGSIDGVFTRYLSYHQQAFWSRIPGLIFSPARTLKALHDRGACWWILSSAQDMVGYEEFGLRRLMDEGPMPLDPLYADGDITDMPTGILAWRHMDIDKNDKIWIATDDETAAVGASVFRIDPYPLDGGNPNALTPIRLNQIAKQTDLAAAGLPTSDASGVVCDNINGDVVHGRTWIVCGADGSLDGGIWYSEDGGATMKGLVHEKSALTGTNLWNVAADGVTVTNPAADALLHLELVAGEWITFEDGLKSESKRQVTSITDANTLVLTAATTFGGAQAGLIMAKGAINGTHIGLYRVTGSGGYNSDSAQGNPPVDHDSSGRLHWQPSDYTQGTVRFDPGSTDPVSFIDRVSLQAGYGTMGRCNHVGVTRMPDPLGVGSIWHDNVWVGGGWDDGMTRVYGWESYCNSGVASAPDQFQDAGRPFVATDVGKYVRIHKSGSGNDATRKITAVAAGVATLDTPALANETNICWELFGITRYVSAAGPPANSFPDVVYVYHSSNHTFGNPSVVQDRVNGAIWLRIRGKHETYYEAGLYMLQTMLPPSDPDCGSIISYNNWNVTPANYDGYSLTSNASGAFDDLGMGTFMTAGYQHRALNYANRVQPVGRQVAPRWSCLLWNGSQWSQGPLNDYLADIDFDGSESGPYAEYAPAPGQGTRRVTDWAVPLEHGLCLRFDQAGSPTSQVNEFVADENTTWVCAIGRHKDNTMTAEWQTDVNYLPTVVRQDEPAVDVGSPWTVVDGWDGGYIDSADDQDFPSYCRGVAEGDDSSAHNGTTGEYFTFWGMTGNNPANMQLMTALRVHDEEIHAAGAGGLDIATVGGVGKATDSAGANFVDADVGKTLRVEGAANATNNTSRVIVALDGVSPQATVILDAPWPAADELARAWRVRDIPEVSFAALLFHIQENTLGSYNWRLLSSRDGGRAWDEVKWTDDVNGAAVNSLISAKRNPGVYFSRGALNPVGNDYQMANQNNYLSLIFDLTTAEIDSAQRRRTHWKIVRTNPNGATQVLYPQTMLLLNSDYAPVLNPDLMPTDRLDPLWFGMASNDFKALFHESAGAVSIGQSASTPIAYGDVVTEAGAGYWLQNAADIKAYASTSKVTAASAPFSWQDVGRKLRLPTADIVLAVDETYSGFLTIVSVESTTEATVERTFDSQDSGTATITNNGGQALISDAGHSVVNNDPVTLAGTTDYDGEHVAVNVVAGVSFEIGVAYVNDRVGTWDKGQQGLTWATVNFGALDRVRFDDTTTWYQHIGRALATLSFKIMDVPTTNTIVVENMDIPIGVTAAFAVEREFDRLSKSQHTYSQDFEDGFNAYWMPRSGIYGVSDEGQFNVIDEDTSRSAASGADADGDGWADDITITGHNVAAAIDDWILLYNPLTQADDRYRRWYKIKTITPGANTTLTTYEDEIPPGETFKWKIARKRDMRMRSVYAVISAREPI